MYICTHSLHTMMQPPPQQQHNILTWLRGARDRLVSISRSSLYANYSSFARALTEVSVCRLYIAHTLCVPSSQTLFGRGTNTRRRRCTHAFSECEILNRTQSENWKDKRGRWAKPIYALTLCAWLQIQKRCARNQSYILHQWRHANWCLHCWNYVPCVLDAFQYSNIGRLRLQKWPSGGTSCQLVI